MSAGKLFLSISDQQVTVYAWRNRRCDAGTLFRQSEEELQRFARYLEEHDPSEPVYILVNSAEEEMRQELVPVLYGPDRREMIERQLNRHFRNTPYRRADSQGRVRQEKNKQERILFSALMEPRLLTPWLERLQQRRHPVVGIWSVPLLSREVLRKIDRKAARALLISWNSSGLRQTYFHQGRTLVSRLTPFPLQEINGLIASFLQEVEKTQGYLVSLRLISREDPLDLFILGQGEFFDLLPELSAAVERTGNGLYRCHTVSAAILARQFGMKSDLGEAGLERIFGFQLMTRHPANHYARASETHLYKLHHLRAVMRFSTTLLPVLGVVTALGLWWEGEEVDGRGAVLLRQVEQAQHELEQAKVAVPPSDFTGGEIKSAVEMVEKIKAGSASPEWAMVVISQILLGYPRIWVDGFEWVSDADPNAELGKREGNKPAAGKSAPVVTNPEEKKEIYHIVHFKGKIQPFYGDVREAMQWIDQLIVALRAETAVVQVKPISLPLNLGAEVSLSGESGGAAAKAARSGVKGEFVLRVVLRSPDGASPPS